MGGRGAADPVRQQVDAEQVPGGDAELAEPRQQASVAASDVEDPALGERPAESAVENLPQLLAVLTVAQLVGLVRRVPPGGP